jgi:hypothetical protein
MLNGATIKELTWPSVATINARRLRLLIQRTKEPRGLQRVRNHRYKAYSTAARLILDGRHARSFCTILADRLRLSAAVGASAT